jgi:hypothetical protein
MTRRLKTCNSGHSYYKSSECPVCPVCEASRRPADGFLAQLAAPARRALTGAGIVTLERLSEYSEKQILGLHGMGPSSIPKLRSALLEHGLHFR